MAANLIRYDVDDRGVASIILDDPSSRNALSDELTAALERAWDDVGVKVVVVTSADERVFSSGGNLKAFADESPVIKKYAGLDRFPRLYQLLGGLGKPSLCAANGDVLVGAFGLALACHLIVAREGVRFGCPEINVEVFPFMISALIYRSVPRAKANELMLTGELMTAEEALGLHIVNKVVPAAGFEAEVRRLAGRITSRSPLLMHLGKQTLNASRDLPLPDALNYLQGMLALAFTTEDIIDVAPRCSSGSAGPHQGAQGVRGAGEAAVVRLPARRWSADWTRAEKASKGSSCLSS
jgi:enoyl-CoA hydratase/carnithine racemase